MWGTKVSFWTVLGVMWELELKKKDDLISDEIYKKTTDWIKDRTRQRVPIKTAKKQNQYVKQLNMLDG